ncbi:hypothetical protein MAR_029568 [Mya arenaria]|uniref:Uncharacterized protein n=1 Tax=Mya arenaria TaxID=6604 RepID=A0ABY7DIY5_MYAAR|nr:hypothetical protein MAR_029568 [Mya arenaria]
MKSGGETGERFAYARKNKEEWLTPSDWPVASHDTERALTVNGSKRHLPIQYCSVYWYVTSCLLLMTSAIMLVTSASIPRWLRMDCNRPGNIRRVHDYALWYLIVCKEDVCQTWSYTSVLTNTQSTKRPLYDDSDVSSSPVVADLRLSKGQMVGTEIEITAAFLLELLTFSIMLRLSIKSRRTSIISQRFHLSRRERARHADVCLHCSAFLAAIVAAVCIFIPFERFAEINRKLSTIDVHTGCSISTPFGIIVLGFSGLALVLSAIFNVRIIYSRVSQGCTANGDDVMDEENRKMVALVAMESKDNNLKGYADPMLPGYSNIDTETEVT